MAHFPADSSKFGEHLRELRRDMKRRPIGCPTGVVCVTRVARCRNFGESTRRWPAANVAGEAAGGAIGKYDRGEAAIGEACGAGGLAIDLLEQDGRPLAQHCVIH